MAEFGAIPFPNFKELKLKKEFITLKNTTGYIWNSYAVSSCMIEVHSVIKGGCGLLSLGRKV